MIENIIDQVYDGRFQARDAAVVTGIMVHRTGVDLRSGYVLGYDAVSICNAFTGKAPSWASVAKATGSQNPYTFIIGGDLDDALYNGKVWQALPLSEVGHHARRFSRPCVGIGCIGDFRTVPPSEAQRTALVDLCADLCSLFSLNPARVKGHGEVPGAHGGSKAPGKANACPGDLLDMDALRDEIKLVIEAKNIIAAQQRLSAEGLVF